MCNNSQFINSVRFFAIFATTNNKHFKPLNTKKKKLICALPTLEKKSVCIRDVCFLEAKLERLKNDLEICCVWKTSGTKQTGIF